MTCKIGTGVQERVSGRNRAKRKVRQEHSAYRTVSIGAGEIVMQDKDEDNPERVAWPGAS